jgi:GT2 family glycosyltransferase
MIRHVAGAAGPPDGACDVDVVILALDRAVETCAAIDSALEQTGVSRHVVVLDQGSRPDALARVAAHVAGRPDVSLWASPVNLGVGGGRNRATALGRGRVIAALDNDAAFDSPDTLARAVAALEEDPALGIVGCRIVSDFTGRDDLSSWGYPARMLAQSAATFEAATFVGAGHMIRRAAWNEAGGYDPRLFFCWEEFDLSLRAIAAGWRIRYRGDLVVRHKVSGEQRVAWSAGRWHFHVRNRLFIARKYGASWMALLPRIAGYLLRGLRNGLLPQTLSAILDAVRMAPAGAPLPAAALAYLAMTDTARRGGWGVRLRQEVLAGLPIGIRRTVLAHHPRALNQSVRPLP